MAHWSSLVAILLSTLFVVVIIPLQANTESPESYTTTSCFRKETYNTTSTVKVKVPVNKTRYDWCLGGFMRCMVYKVEMAERDVNVTEIHSRMVEMCCPGTVPAPGTPSQSINNVSLQCIPANEASTTTVKTTTIATTTPREVCKAGLWGRGCSNACECGLGTPCDQDTGACGQVVSATTCSPTDPSCVSSTPRPTEAATQPSTTSTTSTTQAPTTSPSTVPSSSPSPSPSPTTVPNSPSTPPATSTVPSTPSTPSTQRTTTVTTEKIIPPSKVPETPLVATTESPRTVSTPNPIARLTDLTTVRPIVVATRGWDAEHVTIERRKDAKSMAQPAKTTAQHIDPDSDNRVDTSAGNGKPKPDAAPTSTISITTSPSSTTTQKPPSTRLPFTATSTAANTKPAQVTTIFDLRNLTQMTSTSPKPTSLQPTLTSLEPTSLQPPSWSVQPTSLQPPSWSVKSTSLQPPSWSVKPTSLQPPSSSVKPTSLQPPSSSVIPTSLGPPSWSVKSTLIQTAQTTLATPAPNTTFKKSSAVLDDNSSTDSESDEDADDDDDTEDDEEDSEEDKNFNAMREETILSPPNKPATRIDHMETKINGSSKKMTWTFQTDFSVGPPIKLATPPPRKNAISPEDNRNSSIPYSDKVNEDKAIVATTVTYGVKPWMPVLNLATSRPEDKTTHFVFSTLDKEILAEFTERTTEHTSSQSPTHTSTTPSPPPQPSPTTMLQTSSTSKEPSTVTPSVATTNSTKTSITTASPLTSPQTYDTGNNLSTSTSQPLDDRPGLSGLSTLLAGNFSTVQTSPSLPSTTETEAKTVPTASSTQAVSSTWTSTSTSQAIPVSTSTLSPFSSSTSTPAPSPASTPVPISASTFLSNPTATSIHSESSSSSTTQAGSRIPLRIIPSESPSISVNTVSPLPVQTITSTLGSREHTTLQGHIAETVAVQHDITSSTQGGSIRTNINLIGSPPSRAATPSPPAVGSGAVGAAVAAIAIALAILAILCVLIILARTRKDHSKRRPVGVAPPPSPPLISAWYTVPHYSETFTTTPPTNRPLVAPATPFREQFETPAVEHVYQEITPLANVNIGQSIMSTPAPSPVRTTSDEPPKNPQQSIGPTRVLVRLRNLDEPVVR